MTRPLSPAAQAVVNAAKLAYLRSPGVTLEPAIAAALRAVADAVVPDAPLPRRHASPQLEWVVKQEVRQALAAIANELDPRP